MYAGWFVRLTLSDFLLPRVRIPVRPELFFADDSFLLFLHAVNSQQHGDHFAAFFEVDSSADRRDMVA